MSIFSLFLGCSSGGRLFSPAPEGSEIIEGGVADTATAVADGGYVDTLSLLADEVPAEDPSELIELARILAAEGKYTTADSTLKKAVHSIEALETVEETDPEWFPAGSYLDDVVEVYSEKMPRNFPLPDAIVMSQFQKQMVRAIDSMRIVPAESLAVATMGCQKGLVYDVPMVWNSRVQRAVSFYINRRETTVDRWVQRAPYWLPVMRRIFADSGLPQDLAYLPLIESGFNPLAYSYAHASGIWQFIASTGKIYGLRRTFWIDERRDPIKATHAAASYLKKLYGDFGDWHLALAGYNRGENGVKRSIRRAGHNDFWRLKLPRETTHYVPFFLAAVTVFKNPKCFGITVPPSDTFALDTVLLNDCMNMSDIAEGIGVPLDTLKRINPHIMHWCTPPDVKDATLYLPRGMKASFSAFYDSFAEEKRVRWCRYQVRREDDINSIARRFNITVDNLKTINRLSSNQLPTESWIFLPQQGTIKGTYAVYIPPATKSDFAEQRTTYRVRNGDNLTKISRKFHVSLRNLYRWNKLSHRSRLRIGQMLVVRKTSAPAPLFTMTPPAAGPVKAGDTVRIVQNGDTPLSIAKGAEIGITELVAWNSLDPNGPGIQVGATLRLIPPPDTSDTVFDTTALAAVLQDSIVTDSTNEVSSGTMPQDTIAVSVGIDSLSPQLAAWAEKKAIIPPSIAQVKAQVNAPTITGKRIHRVRRGENPYLISRKYGVSLTALLTANRLGKRSIIKAGQRLTIPSVGTSSSGPEVVYYKVKNGDTLWRIARKFGVSLSSVYEHNDLPPNAVIMPGKVIKIKKM